jgi:hypothetical protein
MLLPHEFIEDKCAYLFYHRNHPKVHKRAPGKSPPHLELTKKHPQTYSTAKWTTHAAPKRAMDATTVKNGTHHTQKRHEKKK